MPIIENYQQMKWIIARAELLDQRRRGSLSYQKPRSSSTIDMHERVSGIHLGMRSVILPEIVDWLEEMKIGMYSVNHHDDKIQGSSLPQIGMYWDEYECEPMSATVHTVLQFMHQHRDRNPVVMRNEYWYHQKLAQRVIDSPKDLTKDDLLILSVPFYSDFRSHYLTNELLLTCTEMKVPVLLDIIWLPLSKQDIMLDHTECVQVVTHSLSKTLPTAGMKGGFAFWKKPISKEQSMYPLGNKLIYHIAKKYLEDFGYYHVRERCLPYQKKWCELFGLDLHDLCYVGIIPKGHWLESENLHSHEFDIKDKVFNLVPYIENDQILTQYLKDQEVLTNTNI